MAEDPVRLFDEGGSELMLTLLAAAREEQPHAAAVRRTLTAVGVGAAVASVSASAAGASAATGAASVGSVKGLASSAFLAAAKWLAVGAVAGAVATSAVYGVARAPLPSPASKTAPTATIVEPVAAKPAKASAPQATPALSAAPAVPEAPTAVTAAPSAVPSSRAISTVTEAPLAAEVLALDSARQALAAGNAPRTLQLLNAYEADFSAPRMLPEALYLRLEALTLEGDKLGTEAVARRLLRAYPGGPHAARARSILGLDQ